MPGKVCPLFPHGFARGVPKKNNGHALTGTLRGTFNGHLSGTLQGAPSVHHCRGRTIGGVFRVLLLLVGCCFGFSAFC